MKTKLKRHVAKASEGAEEAVLCISRFENRSERAKPDSQLQLSEIVHNLIFGIEVNIAVGAFRRQRCENMQTRLLSCNHKAC